MTTPRRSGLASVWPLLAIVIGIGVLMVTIAVVGLAKGTLDPNTAFGVCGTVEVALITTIGLRMVADRKKDDP